MQLSSILANHKANLSDMGWIIVGQLGTSAFGLVAIKLITSLGPAVYGYYALALTMVALASSLLYGPIEQTFGRFLSGHENQQEPSQQVLAAFRGVLVVTGGCLAIGAFLFVLLALAAGHATRFWETLCGVSFVITTGTASCPAILLNILKMRRLNAILYVAERALGVLLLLVAVFVGTLDVLAVLMSFSLSALLVTILRMRALSRKLGSDGNHEKLPHGPMEPSLWFRMRDFALPFFIWGLFGWIQLNGERLIIAGFLSISELGIYSLMMTVVTFLIVIPQGVIAQFVTPIVYDKFDDLRNISRVNEGIMYTKSVAYAVSFLVCAAIVITYVVGNDLLLLISTSEFATHHHLLPMLCFGVGAYYVAQTLCLIGIAMKRPDAYLPAKIGVAMVGLVSYFLLISSSGLEGVWIAVAVVGFSYLAWVLSINKRLLAARV